MGDESFDSASETASTHEVAAPTAFVDAAGAEDTEQYLLNDIGVALRLLSERG